jgi:hypothetical protein
MTSVIDYKILVENLCGRPLAPQSAASVGSVWTATEPFHIRSPL